MKRFKLDALQVDAILELKLYKLARLEIQLILEELKSKRAAAKEKFADDFGFQTVLRSADELHLRGCRPGTQCVVIHKGRKSRFVGPVFRSADRNDLSRLARAHDTLVRLNAVKGVLSLVIATVTVVVFARRSFAPCSWTRAAMI